jgi:hypothetical protein
MTSEKEVDFGGLKLKFVGAEFVGPIGEIAIPGIPEVQGVPTVPEEVAVDLRFKVLRGDSSIDRVMRIRFNFGNFLGGHSGIITEPMVIDNGLDEYYYVVSPISAVDLYYMYAKVLIIRATMLNSSLVKMVYSHLLAYMAQSLGKSYEDFVNETIVWQPENALIQNSFIVSFKRVPIVRLLWISATLMILGEIITIVSRHYKYVGRSEEVSRK